MHELLTLNITGAFKSPVSDVCLYVDNQPGFDYVTLQDGEWVSTGILRPETVLWLTGTNLPTLKLGPEWTNVRISDHYLGALQCVVHYGSVHHRDER